MGSSISKRVFAFPNPALYIPNSSDAFSIENKPICDADAIRMDVTFLKSKRNSTQLIACHIIQRLSKASTSLWCLKEPPHYRPRCNRPIIIMSHANAEDMGCVYQLALDVSQAWDVNIMLYDYPGYGWSTGSPTEEGCYDAIETCLHHLIENEDYNMDNIYLWGKSVGTGPTCYLAAKYRVAGVILQSAFASVFNIVLNGVQTTGLDWFPNITRVAQIEAPLLIVHGGQDTMIKPAHARKLHKRAAYAVNMLMIPTAGHNDVEVEGGQLYLSVIKRYIVYCYVVRHKYFIPHAIYGSQLTDLQILRRILHISKDRWPLLSGLPLAQHAENLAVLKAIIAVSCYIKTKKEARLPRDHPDVEVLIKLLSVNVKSIFFDTYGNTDESRVIDNYGWESPLRNGNTSRKGDHRTRRPAGKGRQKMRKDKGRYRGTERVYTDGRTDRWIAVKGVRVEQSDEIEASDESTVIFADGNMSADVEDNSMDIQVPTDNVNIVGRRQSIIRVMEESSDSVMAIIRQGTSSSYDRPRSTRHMSQYYAPTTANKAAASTTLVPRKSNSTVVDHSQTGIAVVTHGTHTVQRTLSNNVNPALSDINSSYRHSSVEVQTDHSNSKLRSNNTLGDELMERQSTNTRDHVEPTNVANRGLGTTGLDEKNVELSQRGVENNQTQNINVNRPEGRVEGRLAYRGGSFEYLPSNQSRVPMQPTVINNGNSIIVTNELPPTSLVTEKHIYMRTTESTVESTSRGRAANVDPPAAAAGLRSDNAPLHVPATTGHTRIRSVTAPVDARIPLSYFKARRTSFSKRGSSPPPNHNLNRGGRSPSPIRHLNMGGRSPPPMRHLNVRGRSPSPILLNIGGRSSSPNRQRRSPSIGVRKVPQAYYRTTTVDLRSRSPTGVYNKIKRDKVANNIDRPRVPLQPQNYN